MRTQLKAAFGKLTPKQQQWALLGGASCGLFGVLYLLFAVSDQPSHRPAAAAPGKTVVTNVMPAGQQVDPRDRWVGDAGKRLAEHEAGRAAQEQFNQQILHRFEALEKQLTQTPAPAPVPVPPPVPLPPPPSPPAPAATWPPPAPAGLTGGALPAGLPPSLVPPSPGLIRITLERRNPPATPVTTASTASPNGNLPATMGKSPTRHYLPVSFTRAILLGGVDAPTGGQAQDNPLPIFLKLLDDAVLPNHFRGQVRDCFVVASAYGDLSSERIHARLVNLSCIRTDGQALEAAIKGEVFGEDGKNGLRGRLVEKQGQLLAKALQAGIASGIGSAFGVGATTLSVSPLGTTQTVDRGKAFEYGLSTGVGRALDRLAQYYIKMAEATFPVIEVDAGRIVDVALTKGVLLDAPGDGAEQLLAVATHSNPRMGGDDAAD